MPENGGIPQVKYMRRGGPLHARRFVSEEQEHEPTGHELSARAIRSFFIEESGHWAVAVKACVKGHGKAL